jgi:predicted RNA-binding Zn-ribbon protein involved in translation (DUF1610 family)
MANRPLEDWEDPEPDDADDADDDDSSYVCPNCGQNVYEDCQQCPHCGDYIRPRSRSVSAPGGRWLILAVALMAILTLLAVFFSI